MANPRGPDADFYLSLAGSHRVSILDLGCGTGTLCCALAECGHEVTGVDPAEAMLAVAKRKPHAEQVEWVKSSAQNYRSKKKFDLIVMTGHAFQTLLTDDEALAAIQNMHCHLKQNGRIAFETRNPRVNWAGDWASRPPRKLAGDQVVEALKVITANGEFISFETSYRFLHETLTTNSTLRFPSREHVEALITQSGLAVRDLFGDWNAGSFEPASSREMIFIAEMAQ